MQVWVRSTFQAAEMPPESFAPLALPNAGAVKLVRSVVCNGVSSIDPDQGSSYSTPTHRMSARVTHGTVEGPL